MRLRTTLLAVLVGALAGCACDTVPDTAVTDCDAQVVPGGAAVDILFVVDDSGSMREEQAELADNLGQFIDALVNAPVHLDLRVGVTNTSIDRGGAGASQGEYGTRMTYGTASGGVNFPGVAGTPYPAGAVVAIRQDPEGVGTAGQFVWGRQYDLVDPVNVTSTWGGPRILSNGSTLARDFKANVLQGTWGSGKEQPLQAMQRALDGANCPGFNCGLQRDGARLAVVILTDEDDCSSPAGAVDSDTECRQRNLAGGSGAGDLFPLSDYVDFLGSTTFGGPDERPIFALIAGFDPNGVATACRGSAFVPPTTTAAAAVPRRLEELRTRLETAAAGTTLKKSICGQFGPALLDIAAAIIPQELTLEQAPADYRMLAVSLDRGGTTVPCETALKTGTPADDAEQVVYTPPAGGEPARLEFQNGCRLGVGDRVQINVVCAR